MTLREKFEQSGNWLFRWRSYLPLLLFVPLVVEMHRSPSPIAGGWFEMGRQAVCFAISMVGFALRVFTVGHTPPGTSGRTTRRQKAASLNTTGAYSLLRHPLYLANLLMWLGIALSCCTWSLLVIFLLAFSLYYERIMFAEEEYLRRRFGPQFEQWAATTPAFLPRIANWTPPSQSFSMRKILRKEYSGLFAVVAGFCLARAFEHATAEKRLFIEPAWLVLLLATFVVYLILRTLHTRTRLLAAD
ncbi:MAG: DUF1295 domain-containing protein [Rhodopirellula sp.]|nr:DUF1295 domain-containing protein [Rhodopirellula sp.]